ncbi:MAG: hypothetical protein F9K46_12995 [Anaerolineae bacterium]|nr:MAG: hypothetical protein F9K46_12995 [Anaerolineae bacterium]
MLTPKFLRPFLALLLMSTLFISGSSRPSHIALAASDTYHIKDWTTSGCINSPGTMATKTYPVYSRAGATLELVMTYTITDAYNLGNGGSFWLQISEYDGAWLGGGGASYSPYTGTHTARAILSSTGDRQLYLTYWCSGYGSVSRIDFDISITITSIDPILAAEEAAGLARVHDSALPIIIYTPTAAHPERFIDIRDLDGKPLLIITADDLAALPDYPIENMLIASTSDRFISVYKLTTGEYQVSVGPLTDGKVHVVIFDGIPPTHTYGYTFGYPDEQ